MLKVEEIAEEYEVEGKEVLTPNGWRAIKKVYKTIPLAVVEVVTVSKVLRCSKHHMIKTTRGWVEAQDLRTRKDRVHVDGPHGTEPVLEVFDPHVEEELYDITIDDPSGEFYSNGIVSHNSTTFCANQMTLSHIIPRLSSLYIAPSFPMLETYASRFLDMEGFFRFPMGKQNKYSKRYANGSKIDMAYCLESARDVRGKSVDTCVTGDAVLIREDGTEVRMRDVQIGDKIAAWNGSKVVYDTVTAKKCNGVKPCFRIKLSTGDTLEATGNHKVYTGYGWDRVDEIIPRLEENITTIIACIDGEKISYKLVDDIIACPEQSVYDITTQITHTFFACNLLVHNCLLDEVQNFNPDILPEVLYTQAMSKLPMTVYAGTALSTDTLLEDKWRHSSMGMWHVRAMDGKHWLNMYDRKTLYEVCNNPQGPTCPYTKKKLDVTDGCYVHANKQALEAGDVGIHVPQCIITDIANDPVQWLKVYKHIQEDDFKKVLQECFGIAVAEGTREITQQDLQNACLLQQSEDEIVERCNRGYYRTIISGCDWGGSDYNPAQKTKKSYTVHCIIGLAPDGITDILYYHQYSGMDYHTIAGMIMADHRRFKAKAIATDFGVGMAYNNEIRRYMPLDRHFIMDYVGPQCAAMATPKGDHLPNQIALNRTEALTNVFKDLKMHKIRARSWDASGKYLLDWLNMFRVPTETASGKKTFLYRRNPQKSDDALHAFNFAYALMKFYKGESLVEDPEVTKRIRAVLFAQTPQEKQAAAQLQQQLAANTQWVLSLD